MANGITPVSLQPGAMPQLEALQAGQVSRGRVPDVANEARANGEEGSVGAVRSAFAAKEILNDASQREAQVARTADTVLRSAKDTLQGMIDAAVAIVKNYPPFPQGSSERQAYLDSITGLRQQLEAMLVPPLPGAPEKPEPVIYPRDDAQVLEGMRVNEDLLPPALDPKKASDEDVADLLNQSRAALGSIEAFLEQLRKNVDAAAGQGGPALPAGTDALEASRRAGLDVSAAGLVLSSETRSLIG